MRQHNERRKIERMQGKSSWRGTIDCTNNAIERDAGKKDKKKEATDDREKRSKTQTILDTRTAVYVPIVRTNDFV